MPSIKSFFRIDLASELQTRKFCPFSFFLGIVFLNGIEGNNFFNLQSMKSDANFEALEQMKGMQEKFKKETIEEAKEFEDSDSIAQRLSDGLTATHESEFIKTEIIKSAHQADSALWSLRKIDISEDIKAGVEKGQEMQGSMSTCIGAFLKNVPPSFC